MESDVFDFDVTDHHGTKIKISIEIEAGVAYIRLRSEWDETSMAITAYHVDALIAAFQQARQRMTEAGE